MGELDLHLHTYYSNDGEYTPKDIVQLCVKQGVTVAAITDHNTTRGVREGLEAAKEAGIKLLSGIEMDCICHGVYLHLLGYHIDAEDTIFAQLESDIKKQEQVASVKRVDKIRSLGIQLDMQKLMQLSVEGVVTGEMIAEVALLQEENKEHPLLLPYRNGGKRSDNPYVNFYWDFCTQGKPAYVPISYIDIGEAVKQIQRTGGIAVLAHPGMNVKEEEGILDEIMSYGVAGIEVYSSYHTKEQTDFYKSYAQKYHKIITCGSDFHGKIKPKILLGSVSCMGMESEIKEGLQLN